MLQIERGRPEGTSSSEPEPSDELWCELDDELVSEETTVDPTIGMSAAAAAPNHTETPMEHCRVQRSTAPAVELCAVFEKAAIDRLAQTDAVVPQCRLHRTAVGVYAHGESSTDTRPRMKKDPSGYSLEVPVGHSGCSMQSERFHTESHERTVRCAVADCVTDRCVCSLTAGAAHVVL